MSPEVLRNLVEERFALRFSLSSFESRPEIQDAAQLLDEWAQAAPETSAQSLAERLRACEGWKSRPPRVESPIEDCLPRENAMKFWESLRSEAGVDHWPELREETLLPAWHLIPMAAIPVVVFFGALWLTGEMTLAAIIAALNLAYLIAFAWGRHSESRPRIKNSELSLLELAGAATQRNSETEEQRGDLRQVSREELAERLRAKI